MTPSHPLDLSRLEEVSPPSARIGCKLYILNKELFRWHGQRAHIHVNKSAIQFCHVFIHYSLILKRNSCCTQEHTSHSSNMSIARRHLQTSCYQLSTREWKSKRKGKVVGFFFWGGGPQWYSFVVAWQKSPINERGQSGCGPRMGPAHRPPSDHMGCQLTLTMPLLGWTPHATN